MMAVTILGVIPIHDVVKRHFKDIDRDENLLNVTYENAQARERTQILMDLANNLGRICGWDRRSFRGCIGVVYI